MRWVACIAFDGLLRLQDFIADVKTCERCWLSEYTVGSILFF